ncbi:hypothetical protein [Halomonas sp. C22]|uniref:hypothetical protein n=1 Tax=Halomonas sp. C22 TaxID=2580567 RepID=UPI0011A69B3F|nr:hypothetical protein [Halomonas sp. C22]
MKDQFEIRLDFKPNTGSPERVFLAMAQYVNAFENLVLVVGKGIAPDNVVTCELSAVETGSISSIVDCIGGYCSTLSKIPLMIAQHMVDLDEIDREDQIETFTKKLEDDVLSDTVIDFPNQANINRLEVAKGLYKLAEASKMLVQGETVDVRKKDSNVYYINTKTRFAREPEDLFKEHFEVKRTTEILLVRKPVFVGYSMWDFKSIQRKKIFSAPIEDKNWLERYQNREIHLEPGDAINAFVEFSMYKEKGAKYFSYKDHKVLTVGHPIKNDELQQMLEFENKNDEV